MLPPTHGLRSLAPYAGYPAMLSGYLALLDGEESLHTGERVSLPEMALVARANRDPLLAARRAWRFIEEALFDRPRRHLCARG